MYFTGFPKENFRENMIKFWMDSENVDEETALSFYDGWEFDKLCKICDGTTLLTFKYEIEYPHGINKKECFEINDNNVVIPVNIINIYKEQQTIAGRDESNKRTNTKR